MSKKTFAFFRWENLFDTVSDFFDLLSLVLWLFQMDKGLDQMEGILNWVHEQRVRWKEFEVN
jgi:hypothetical protein